MPHPRVFISYSWDDEDHKSWVRMLATELQTNGVHVFLDQWDAHPGIDLPTYMESSVRDADHVLLICTPPFAMRANTVKGGVGYEKVVVTGEIFGGASSPRKFVPLLRRGEHNEALPSYLKSRGFIDFRDEGLWAVKFEDLLRHIHGAPRFVRPPVGQKPQFSTGEVAESAGQTGTQLVIFCTKCGREPGSYSSCIGGGAHEYKRFTHQNELIYCVWCGKEPGSYSSCIGGEAHRYDKFSGPQGSILCTRCGKTPGSYSSCIAGERHEFRSV